MQISRMLEAVQESGVDLLKGDEKGGGGGGV